MVASHSQVIEAKRLNDTILAHHDEADRIRQAEILIEILCVLG